MKVPLVEKRTPSAMIASFHGLANCIRNDKILDGEQAAQGQVVGILAYAAQLVETFDEGVGDWICRIIWV